MPHPNRRPRRFIAPHPLVTLSGVAMAVTAYFVGRQTGFQPAYAYILFAVCFAICFSALSRRSARYEAEKREREVEDLKNRRVLNLDE